MCEQHMMLVPLPFVLIAALSNVTSSQSVLSVKIAGQVQGEAQNLVDSVSCLFFLTIIFPVSYDLEVSIRFPLPVHALLHSRSHPSASVPRC